jgi:hypothetical protein
LTVGTTKKSTTGEDEKRQKQHQNTNGRHFHVLLIIPVQSVCPSAIKYPYTCLCGSREEATPPKLYSRVSHSAYTDQRRNFGHHATQDFFSSFVPMIATPHADSRPNHEKCRSRTQPPADTKNFSIPSHKRITLPSNSAFGSHLNTKVCVL